MTKREELDLFLTRADELANGKYILADIKIVNLLKAIALSDTLLALFKNCVDGFDYEQAKKKYLVKSQYLSADKGEFVLPDNSRELLAFVFNILMDLDAKRLILGEFLDKYFYEDGSCYAGYTAFVNSVIKPFRNTVKIIMESVIDGKLQDPVEALFEEEKKREKEREDLERQKQKEKELSKKTYGESIKKVREMLLTDKTKVKSSKKTDAIKNEITLVIDMLANVIESDDKDAVEYAFVAYKYVARAYKMLFRGRVKKINKLLKDIVNEI